MDIYSDILKTNKNHLHRRAISMTMASGEVRKYTYEVLLSEANRYANQLLEAGIDRGDRVALVAENSPAWQMAFLAIMQLQATAVLIDHTLSEELLKSCIDKADVRCIFTSTAVKEKLGDAVKYRIPMFNLSQDGQVFADSYKVLSPFVSRTEDPRADIAMIFFDVNHEEEINGVMYTHEAMIQNVQSIVRENALSRSERILSTIPNSKIEGMVACVLSTMLVGGAVHYIEVLDDKTLNHAFKSFKPTIFPASRALLMQLKEKFSLGLDGQPLNETTLARCQKVRHKSGLRIGNMFLKQIVDELGGKLEIIWCYGPIEEEIMRFYYALGIDILMYYGRLETNVPILGNRDEEITLNTCGQPYPNMEIQLMNPNEQGIGEMYVKSPYGMAGYFRDEAAYKKHFDQGWFKTGDLAELVNHSYVKVHSYHALPNQDESYGMQKIQETSGLPNKTNQAYYWFNTWKQTAQHLYKIQINHEEYLPKEKGCIIYAPLETTKGYLGLTVGYSKERFFKFGYLTTDIPKEHLKLEDEAFGKIHFEGEELDKETREVCYQQLKKGWTLIIRAPKDVLNSACTDQVIALAKQADVAIIPAYLEGEENVFSGKEDRPKWFDFQLVKRYQLALRYGKPIEAGEEVLAVKRQIQQQFIALIENQSEEVEEPEVDELTKLAMEILSRDEIKNAHTFEDSKDTEEKEDQDTKELESLDIEDQDTKELESFDIEEEDSIEHVDLSDLLAVTDLDEMGSEYEEEISFERDCLSQKSDEA